MSVAFVGAVYAYPCLYVSRSAMLLCFLSNSTYIPSGRTFWGDVTPFLCNLRTLSLEYRGDEDILLNGAPLRGSSSKPGARTGILVHCGCLPSVA